MTNLRHQIANILASDTEMHPDELALLLEEPPAPEMGDYALPCFSLAKRMKRPPAKVAASLAKTVKSKFFHKIEASGPYLNLTLSRPYLVQLLLTDLQDKRDAYGDSDKGEGRVIVIDFSAPNIAKPFGIGHLRSTIIGNSLHRIFSALGYRVVGINHLGDWGTQFGKLIVAFRRWGDEELLEKDPVHYLYDLYVRFHKEAEEKPYLEDEARSWFRRLEQGDSEALLLWSRFRDLSLNEFKRLYDYLGISFESYQGESFYNDRLQKTIALAEAKGVISRSQGALVVDLEKFKMPPCLLQKSDGATLYATRDLAAAIYRYQNYRFDQMLYVVGAEQRLHFQQLFKVLELMGFEWAQRCHHVPFGMIRLPEGRMSTRKGQTIFLDEVLQKAVDMAREIIEDKNPDLASKDEVARQVGLGAVIFGDLSNDRIKDIEFDWDKILDFTGETAPYIQYSHARICSILRKAGNFTPPDPARAAQLLQAPEEGTVVVDLFRLNEVIERSAQTYKPSFLARYLIQVAKDFNRFYHQCPVLGAEDRELKAFRLALIDGVRVVLKKGLYLLGIEAPEEM